MDTTEEVYKLSRIRIVEQVAINAFSAAIIGILVGLYNGALLLLQAVLHVPSALAGIMAFVALGMFLMLIFLAIAICWFIRGFPIALIFLGIAGLSLRKLSKKVRQAENQ